MNWDAIAFDWNQVRAFLATAEEGSLSAAARALKQTQPTLGRQVAALEDELGVVLFERIGKKLELTPAGRDLLTHVREMAEAATRVSLMAEGRSQAIDGTVRITCSDVFAADLLPRFLLQLRGIAPDLQVDVVAENEISDLQRREADIAIRHVRPEQSDLMARLIGNQRANFYAAPAYLARKGTPKTLADLVNHEFVLFGDLNRTLEFLANIGVPLSAANFPMGSKNGNAAWAMARAGLGLAVMADVVGDAAPEMQRVLPDADPIEFPVWLTTHRELHTSRRIRVVFDLLAEYLGGFKT
ncbi:LysR family transcriptional regulator [Actibacterium mucosum KCTC 23349]|uniref:LysR family transcriptional regulator n=1 Tax=Actibacterium mucosum KCTC 23349 TaxID=1454373 RepID=A0A037ZKD9_9RHOB|nr:LysR family transcriptional regulator [Actibacterium mucosum]KAJ55291.1 LysR family transcriptional regulator [Actibacterium mucosum KCTC 23349]